MPHEFDRLAASMYLQEAYFLIDSLLFRLAQLDAAAERWLAAHKEADAQVGASHDDFDIDAFNEALRDSGHAQSTIFDEVEAFLAAWARLSLLFWPAPPRSAVNREFTLERGKRLVQFLQLAEDHPLTNRDLRNAWMHADERFDDAWVAGRLGNRQQFVRTSGAVSALEHSVCVVDVESLTIYLRDATGSVRSRSLRLLRPVLEDLLARRQSAFRQRFAELPSHQ